MGDLLHFPGTVGTVCDGEAFEDFCIRQVHTKDFIERPWKRTMEEWGELLKVDPSLEKRLREFRRAFFDGV